LPFTDSDIPSIPRHALDLSQRFLSNTDRIKLRKMTTLKGRQITVALTVIIFLIIFAFRIHVGITALIHSPSPHAVCRRQLHRISHALKRHCERRVVGRQPDNSVRPLGYGRSRELRTAASVELSEHRRHRVVLFGGQPRQLCQRAAEMDTGSTSLLSANAHHTRRAQDRPAQRSQRQSHQCR
jgi:hypothetical protein